MKSVYLSGSDSGRQGVLVLDGDTLPALVIIRSLGKKQVPVAVASHEADPLCKYSRYGSQTLSYPNPLQATARYVEWVQAVLSANPNWFLLPVTERSLVPLINAFSDKKIADRIMMASADALETVLDKSASGDLAERCNVSLPASWSVSDEQQLTALLPSLSYPVVVKPGRSISAGEQRVQLTVRYAHSEEELRKICAEFLQQVHVVLQEYFSGEGLGIELIANRGDICYAFQHKRLHEMPLTGGGSSYRMSTEIDEELLQASKRLIKDLNWHGVAMVEFKKDPVSGRYIFIEINGRFWGSLPLATAAGADFPWLLYGLYSTGAVPVIPPYQRGVKCRKLSSDLGWLEAVLRKDADQRLVEIPSIKEALGDWVDIIRPNHYFDAQSFQDIKPGFVDIWRIAKSYINRLYGIYEERRERRQLLAANHPQRYARQIEPDSRVLFLCYGNINRSALAHVLAVEKKPEHTEQFRSAGFHPIDNRPMDERMQALTVAAGVNVDEFRSATVNEEMMSWAQVILVMEVAHVQRLLAEYPACADKVLLLGGLSEGDKEIPDPYNKSEQLYRDVYAKVRDSVNGLVRLMNTSEGS